MRIAKIPPSDREGVLRWGALKALSLLRIHRDELDDVAFAMRQGEKIEYLIDKIENRNKCDCTSTATQDLI